MEAKQTLFVPRGENALINHLTLTNTTNEKKELDLFSYIEFCLWDANDDSTNFQRNYSIGEVEVIGSAIYHKTEYRERRDHYAVFWCNREVQGFDTSREAFCGPYSGAMYDITVDHSAGNQYGIKEFRVNGQAIEGCIIPIFPAGSKVKVEIVMG